MSQRPQSSAQGWQQEPAPLCQTETRPPTLLWAVPVAYPEEEESMDIHTTIQQYTRALQQQASAPLTRQTLACMQEVTQHLGDMLIQADARLRGRLDLTGDLWPELELESDEDDEDEEDATMSTPPPVLTEREKRKQKQQYLNSYRPTPEEMRTIEAQQQPTDRLTLKRQYAEQAWERMPEGQRG